jgi:hypothetical protein
VLPVPLGVLLVGVGVRLDLLVILELLDQRDQAVLQEARDQQDLQEHLVQEHLDHKETQ